MLQELFRLPIVHWPVYGYGLMLVIGFLSGAHLAKFLARRSGLDGEIFMNAALLGLVTGIIGARLSHVLENLREFSDPNKTVLQNFLNMVNIPSGGLTYYGGFLLAFPTLVIYAIRKKVPLPLGMDIVAPALMLGLAFGRIGCFLNGCCWGATCNNLPWAVQFPYYSNPYMAHYEQHLLQAPGLEKDVGGRKVLISPAEIPKGSELDRLRREAHSLPVHPAQIYSAINCFLLVALLYAYFTLPHKSGRVFAMMLMLEGATRFMLESLRVEPAKLGNLSLSMIIGMGLVVLGVLLWIVFGHVGEPIRAETQQ